MTNEDMEINKLVSKVFKENVEGMLDSVFESKTFMTSMCLLKYIYDRDLNAWNLFIREFSKMNYMDQIQVLTNVSSNIKEQKKSKEKVKGKNG